MDRVRHTRDVFGLKQKTCMHMHVSFICLHVYVCRWHAESGAENVRVLPVRQGVRVEIDLDPRGAVREEV